MKKLHRFIIISLCLLMLIPAGVFADGDAESEFKTFSDFKGKTVSMLTGAPFEELVKSKEPGIKEVVYFASMPDAVLAIKSKKVDAILMNNAIAALHVNRDSSLALFPENLGESNFGFAFAKGDKRRDEWQAAFDRISKEKIDELWEKWTGSDTSKKYLSDQTWPGKNGTIKIATCDTLEPMCYVGDDGNLVGFEIELLMVMAEDLDYHLEIKGMDFASVMAEVQAGRSDIGCGSIIITNERRELVDFIEHYPAAFVLITRSTSTDESNEGFFAGLATSFKRTFITGGRWQMIASGMGMTLLMAVMSGVTGTALGFSLVFLKRRGNKVASAFINAFNSLITGIPVVVILMVFYYVFFGHIDIPAVIVAIIGFSLIFASRAYGVIWNATTAIDPGQREAALALGYTESAAFRKVVLPQAKKLYLPLLSTQFVTLLKETSVAGYITVLDLTRAGDLIRSRTMEAFFPLLSIAFIYFLLTCLSLKMIRRIQKISLKKHDARKIKGVD
ncbi:MAG: transporter substrate-binding domain-containing protein [Lachnospiraceae bacterium]|nr:transporter substrate-binding domain-containing protein [Lachnospiraceae bacterium]